MDFVEPPKKVNLPICNASGQDTGYKDARRFLDLFPTGRCTGTGTGSGHRRRIVTKYQAQLIVHRPLDLNEQRSHRELNALHHRNIIFDGQVGIAGNMTAALDDLLRLRQSFANK